MASRESYINLTCRSHLLPNQAHPQVLGARALWGRCSPSAVRFSQSPAPHAQGPRAPAWAGMSSGTVAQAAGPGLWPCRVPGHRHTAGAQRVRQPALGCGLAGAPGEGGLRTMAGVGAGVLQGTAKRQRARGSCLSEVCGACPPAPAVGGEERELADTTRLLQAEADFEKTVFDRLHILLQTQEEHGAEGGRVSLGLGLPAGSSGAFQNQPPARTAGPGKRGGGRGAAHELQRQPLVGPTVRPGDQGPDQPLAPRGHSFIAEVSPQARQGGEGGRHHAVHPA